MPTKKKKLTTEKDVKTAIRKLLDDFDVWYYMPAASVYSKRGIPDFICCVNGRMVAIEAKRPGVGIKGLSPYQVMHNRKIVKNKGEYIVVWNEETLAQLKDALELIFLINKS